MSSISKQSKSVLKTGKKLTKKKGTKKVGKKKKLSSAVSSVASTHSMHSARSAGSKGSTSSIPLPKVKESPKATYDKKAER